SERSADERGVSASVLEPTRTSTVRAGSLTVRLPAERRVDQSVQTDAPAEPARPEDAVASAGSAPLLSALAADAVRRVRQRLEPLERDLVPAGPARAEAAGLDPHARIAALREAPRA